MGFPRRLYYIMLCKHFDYVKLDNNKNKLKTNKIKILNY